MPAPGKAQSPQQCRADAVRLQRRLSKLEPLLNAERQGNGRGGNLLGDFLKCIDIEGLSNVIAGKIFEPRIDDQAIITCLPGTMRYKAPLGLFLDDAHDPADIALRP